VNPAILWVGTDDGNVQVTRTGDTNWANVRKNIKGVPPGIWVSSVEASHFEQGTAYVTFDGHRSDERSAWVFKTEDFGKSWKNIANDIPAGQVMYVIREDLKNPNLFLPVLNLPVLSQWMAENHGTG
ncbi:MAG: WD40/YVTN/BNR-like repeat-containing protein, partial [bacterium]